MNLPQLTLHDLELLCAIHAQGSITAAAQRLGLSKPTASRHLKQLEERLGVVLVMRSTRSLVFTDDGERFLRHAQLALEHLRRGLQGLDLASTTPQGLLRIFAPLLLGQEVISQVIAQLLVTHPALRIKIELSNARHIVNAQDFDLILAVHTPPAHLPETLIIKKVAQASVGLYASTSWLKTHARPHHPRELDGEQFVSTLQRRFTLTPHDHTLGQPFELVLSDKTRCETIDLHILRALAGAGLGMAVLPQFLVLEPDAWGLEALLPQWRFEPIPIWALCAPQQLHSPRVEAFLHQLELTLSTSSARQLLEAT